MSHHLTAATTAAPEEMPQSRPSSRARRRAISMLSRLLTRTTSSIRLMSRTWGTKPAPMPWICTCTEQPFRACKEVDRGQSYVLQISYAALQSWIDAQQAGGFKRAVLRYLWLLVRQHMYDQGMPRTAYRAQIITFVVEAFHLVVSGLASGEDGALVGFDCDEHRAGLPVLQVRPGTLDRAAGSNTCRHQRQLPEKPTSACSGTTLDHVMDAIQARDRPISLIRIWGDDQQDASHLRSVSN